MKNETNTKTTPCCNCGLPVRIYSEEQLQRWNFCNMTCEQRWEDRMYREEFYGIHR